MLSAPLLRALLNAATAALGLGALIVIVLGLLAMRSAADIQYFRLRRNRLTGAWLGIGLAVILGAATYVLFSLVDPITFHYFPPTPSITPSLTATISPTPTRTRYVTATGTVTPTPYLPPVVGILFKSSVTPAGNAAFSEIMFTQSIDDRLRPLSPGKTFANPLTSMYAVFHHDFINRNAQYTALWWRDGELVYYETKPWDGPREGFAYSLWKPADPQAWKAGSYEVQIFLGDNWKSVGRFEVEGDPNTRTPTPTSTPTGPLSPTPSLTPTPSRISSPTLTPRPSQTPSITPTPTLTRTNTPTRTPTKTWTPSITPWPTLTRTSIPSVTPTPTKTPSRTATTTRTPTATSSPSVTPLPSNTHFPSATPSPTPRRTSTSQPSKTPRPTLPPWPGSTGRSHLPQLPITLYQPQSDGYAT